MQDQKPEKVINNNAARTNMHKYIVLLPLIIVLAGLVILGFGWYMQVDTQQTIGAATMGIGLVALISRLLRKV